MSVWQQVEEQVHCEHPARELRVKTTANGLPQYRRQCLTCGDGGHAIAKVEAARVSGDLARIPPYDEDLPDQWWQRRKAVSRDIQSQERAVWFAEHSAYLNTPAWRRRRFAALARDQYICQAQLSGCTRDAEQVHHLTYRHWQNEPLFDLVSVCVSCHEAITASERASHGAA